MISKYLHLVSSTKSQITIFILLNICGLIFFLLPHNIFSNMLDLELFYSKENVVRNFNAIGPDGRKCSLLTYTGYTLSYFIYFINSWSSNYLKVRLNFIYTFNCFSFDILENTDYETDFKLSKC